jgi:hypothetical protein
MGATFGSAEKKRELIPEGQYDAICYGVVELGTHTRTGAFGTKTNPEIMLMFEIPELQITYEKDGTEVTAPRVINQKFNQLMGDKAKLRGFLEAWRGKSFTDEEVSNFAVENVLGKGITLNIEHSQCGKYANIKTVSPLHKSVKLGKPHNEIINFGIADMNNPAEFGKLYPWIQKIIGESAEAQANTSVYDVPEPAKTAPVEDDDIPF